MLTTTRAKEMMVESLRSPADLSDRLGLQPSAAQFTLMERFQEGDEPLQLENLPDDENTMLRAVALCALWRLLLVPGSSCTVISSSADMGADFMDFLQDITTKIDPALTSICKWPRWNVLQIGTAAGYELRVVSNVESWLSEARSADGVTTFVILGAGAVDDLAFTEACKAIESHVGTEGVKLVTLW